MNRLANRAISVTITPLIVTGFLSSLSALAGENGKGRQAGDIVDVAVSAGQFDTLAAAVFL